MKIGILGAGPAGLYAAILIKRSYPSATIKLFEQNPSDATWGFGVVFSDQALSFLTKDDPQTADLIEPYMEKWTEVKITHQNETVVIDGVGFSSIGRLQLLQLLQKRAAEYDVFPVFNEKIENLAVFNDCDIVIGADGINSVVRAEAPDEFDEKFSIIRNWFCWYGTNRPFDCLTQTFVETEYGFFNAHHYRYTPKLSTFIVECDESTFKNVGFAELSEAESQDICESIFQETLQDANLVANHSVWRQFPVLNNRIWYRDNRVLIGDALHTAHYSIGSGTRLAMEDAIALVHALKESEFDYAKAFPKFQSERQPTLRKITGASFNSGKWYEQFASHMSLTPWEFALSYIMRSGRISAEKLHGMSPKFAAELQARGIQIE